MRRLVVACAFILTLSVVLSPAASAGEPKSEGFGKSLDSWMESYWTWLLGGDQEDRIGKMVFVPLPNGTPISEDCPTILAGEIDVALNVNERFVLPLFVYIGESYVEDVPDDNPDSFPEEVFTGVDMVLMVDGEVVLDSSTDDLSPYFFAFEFDNPIVYDPPQNRGDVNADAAIWGKGIGFLYPPLAPGDHTIDLFLDTGLDLIGSGGECTLQFFNTWNIAVSN